MEEKIENFIKAKTAREILTIATRMLPAIYAKRKLFPIRPKKAARLAIDYAEALYNAAVEIERNA